MSGMCGCALFLALILWASFGAADTPQTPYRTIEVTYSNPDAPGVTLAATLTEPASGGPFPAVLLITGAGPQDRDETISDQKPFRVLADYLTRRGIAVLRADDRGVGESTGRFEGVTTKGFSTDAEAGVRYLQSRTDIDPKQIGLLGHGEGAMIAAMVADDLPNIAFIVMLEATGVPGEQVLLEQTERAEKAADMPRDQIKADRQIGTILYDMAKQNKSVKDMRQALIAYDLRIIHEDGDTGVTTAPWATKLQSFEDPWLRFFLAYDPAPRLAKLKCPVLALSGEKDLQVIADQNVPAIKAALAQGGNKNATVEILPGLNYLLQPAKTGLVYEYASSPVAISPAVLQKIGDWIAAHTHNAAATKE
ncbi:MAG TPA: alpha/beta fold hydrolase [Bryobacteraceae bacterium]|nr:alpha/beta fold hydrolase [Bryobacteraceae bacterium]